MTVRRLLIATSVAFIGAAALAGSAGATPVEGDVIRTDVARGTTETPISIDTSGATAFYVQSLLLKPASSSGWHTHPGTETSVVTAGTVVLQTGTDCVVQTLGAGQALFVPAGVPHRVGNESGLDAEAVVTYTVPADAVVRGDSPNVCP